MLKRKWPRTLFGGLALLVAVSGLGASPALAANSDQASELTASPAPTETSAAEDLGTPDIPDPLLEKLHAEGLQGDVTSVQVGEGAGVLYAGEEGSWVINLNPDTSAGPEELTSSAAVAANFSFGICVGYFVHPHKVGSYLEWGAQDNCTASNNNYYLHKIKVSLYNTCVGALCAILELNRTITSTSAQYFDKVVTVNGRDYCEGAGASNDRTYEQKVTVTVRSVEYAPFWDRGNVVNNCDIDP